MNLRIEDAIDLQNARQKQKNKKAEKPLNHNCITKANLGRMLFPTLSGNTPLIRMSKLLKESKTIRPDWVHVICRATAVDANFLFSMKSIHNEDFEKMKNQKSK